MRARGDSSRRVPDVRTYFDGQSCRYLEERYRRPSCEQFAYATRGNLALGMLPRGPGRLMDLGSGPGVLAPALVAHGYRVCEVDISMEMLRESRRSGLGPAQTNVVTFVQGELPELPFSDAAFDAVVCLGVLAYLEAPAHALAEIRRITKPGGVAILQVSNALCPTSRLHSLLRRVYRDLGEALGGQAFPHLKIPLRSYRLRSLLRVLEAERYRVESWSFYDFRPPLLEWLMPSTALAVTKRLQRFERTNWLGWLAEGIVLKVRAC